jgi:uncharacterized membrane protein YdbT with pleckstrin-like domain
MAGYPGRVEGPGAELVIFHGHPSWRSMLGLHAKGFLAAVAAGVLAGLLSAAIVGHLQAGWVVAAVLVVLGAALMTGLVRRRRTTYTITTRRLTIQVGLLGRQVRETRLEQIQNVNSSQSLLQRAVGVGDVFFNTAGGAAFDFAFRGVAAPRRIARSVDQALNERAIGRF